MTALWHVVPPFCRRHKKIGRERRHGEQAALKAEREKARVDGIAASAVQRGRDRAAARELSQQNEFQNQNQYNEDDMYFLGEEGDGKSAVDLDAIMGEWVNACHSRNCPRSIHTRKMPHIGGVQWGKGVGEGSGDKSEGKYGAGAEWAAATLGAGGPATAAPEEEEVEEVELTEKEAAARALAEQAAAQDGAPSASYATTKSKDSKTAHCIPVAN